MLTESQLAAKRKWAAKNREKILAYRKDYYQKNTAKVLAINKKWADANYDQVREGQHTYYQANRQRVLEMVREWESKNPDKVKKYRQKWLKNNLEKRYEWMRSRPPEEARARAAVARALKSGKLKREPCIACGATTVQAHHDDYSKALEVDWVCPYHHKQLFHKKPPTK